MGFETGNILEPSCGTGNFLGLLPESMENSRIYGVELDSIDATLYYVSEPDEGLRELHARAKTKQEILTELSSGIPEQSDND